MNSTVTVDSASLELKHSRMGRKALRDLRNGVTKKVEETMTTNSVLIAIRRDEEIGAGSGSMYADGLNDTELREIIKIDLCAGCYQSLEQAIRFHRSVDRGVQKALRGMRGSK